MPLTNKGYSARRFPEIRGSIRDRLSTNTGKNISSEPSSTIGLINTSFANSVATVENEAQYFYSQLNVGTAEGTYLDKLVGWVGITRLPAAPATGQVLVERDSEGEINSPVRFSDGASLSVLTPNGLQHSLLECNQVRVEPTSFSTNKTYVITINGGTFSYIPQAGETITDVCNQFATFIDIAFSMITTSVEDDILTIKADNDFQNYMEISFAEFELESISTFNFAQSVDVGDIEILTNTITNIVSGNPTLLSVNNPLTWTEGREAETDEQLRARHNSSAQVSSVATVPAITARILNLVNVESVSIQENTTENVVDGMPPYSYQCVVEGGDPQLIGQAIWESKPAGGRTYGDITTEVEDAFGNVKFVEWSRPESVYVHVEVAYSRYEEESFPINGEESIKSAVVNYLSEMGLGKDVIPTRIIGRIYQNVSGIGDISIRVGVATNAGATNPDSWQTTNIPISNSQFADVTLGRVTVIEGA